MSKITSHIYCVTSFFVISGAIGIIASKFVEKVYGIDWYQRGVLDANGNAKANNIHNVKFVLSKSDVVSDLKKYLLS